MQFYMIKYQLYCQQEQAQEYVWPLTRCEILSFGMLQCQVSVLKCKAIIEWRLVKLYNLDCTRVSARFLHLISMSIAYFLDARNVCGISRCIANICPFLDAEQDFVGLNVLNCTWTFTWRQ